MCTCRFESAYIVGAQHLCIELSASLCLLCEELLQLWESFLDFLFCISLAVENPASAAGPSWPYYA